MMRLLYAAAALGVATLAAAAMLLAPVPAAAQSGSSVDPRCTEASEGSCVDWENGIAIATGTGAPASWARTPAQKNISATRAARLDAARNLLELVKGLNLSSSSTMQAAMVQNDQVEASVQGRLHGIRPVESPRYFSDGSVQVKLEARLAEVVPDNLYLEDPQGPPREIPGPDGTRPGPGGSGVNPDEVYTGLIVDARGTGVQPAMSPKIFDPEGREVYGSAYVSRDYAVRQGIVGYVKSMEAARESERVADSPAVVEAMEARGSNRADLVIPQADADALRQAAQRQNFLSETRVLIVLD